MNRIIPPCARHAVLTILDSMMAGIHFYSYLHLERSVCGFIVSTFAGESITNASHGEFLSVLQASASFWEPCFDDDAAKKYDEHDLGK